MGETKITCNPKSSTPDLKLNVYSSQPLKRKY